VLILMEGIAVPADPRRCVVCRQLRPWRAIVDGDPYCSSECCKLAFGVPAASPLRTGAIPPHLWRHAAEEEDDHDA
jgi:hypothetical protein